MSIHARSLFRRGFAALFAAALTPLTAVAEAPPLTLDDALTGVLRHSPVLAGYEHEVRAADAEVRQAGLRPNPELTFEVEEIPLGGRGGGAARSGALSGSLGGGPPTLSWERAEGGGGASVEDARLTLRLEQAIELGRKRARRVAVAEQRRALRRWDFEAARADVLADTARAYVDALAAQERFTLRRELLDLAREVERGIGLRVEAGQVSPLERNRAQVARSNEAIAVRLAEADLRAARAALASHWAGAATDFGSLAGRLDATGVVPTEGEVLEALSANPDIARWAAEMAERSAALDLERARAVPDVTVGLGVESAAGDGGSARGFELDSGGGYRVFRSAEDGDDREYSLKFEVSVPLPIFDRNQGSIEAAVERAAAASEGRRAAVARATAVALAARESAAASLAEEAALTSDVLSTARETFEKTQTGYREGKFGYLDVLDAQRTLFDVRAARVAALVRHHHAIIDLQRLTGTLPETEEPSHVNE